MKQDMPYSMLMDMVLLSFRTALFPLASVGSQVSWILIVLGLIFGSTNILIDIGILMFSLAVLFQLVTLPVEFNASARALQLLESEGFLYGDENRQAKRCFQQQP